MPDSPADAPRVDAVSGDLAATLALGIDLPPAPEAARLSAFLARAFGGATVALIHYGSHTHDGGGPTGSAFDFFVVVDDYRGAYRALAAATGRIRPGRAAFLNRLLPPNVIAVDDDAARRPTDPEGGTALAAKCCVLSRGDLARACSARPRDHFVRARLFQPVQITWARSDAERVPVIAAIAAARSATARWARPFLPPTFDAAAFARTLLEVSYRAEIRPEDDARVDALLAAERATLLPVMEAVLAAGARARAFERTADGYRDPHPPGAIARRLARVWFGWSKARATLRWAKYVALYDGWLDYVVKKVERGSGERLELTERERRWPLLFLWPRALRFLGARRERHG